MSEWVSSNVTQSVKCGNNVLRLTTRWPQRSVTGNYSPTTVTVLETCPIFPAPGFKVMQVKTCVCPMSEGVQRILGPSAINLPLGKPACKAHCTVQSIPHCASQVYSLCMPTSAWFVPVRLMITYPTAEGSHVKHQVICLSKGLVCWSDYLNNLIY